MTIHGKDRVFISGVENLVQELSDGTDAGLSNCVYVTCGMDIQEIYALFFRHPPEHYACLLYTSPSPRDPKTSRMPSSA